MYLSTVYTHFQLIFNTSHNHCLQIFRFAYVCTLRYSLYAIVFVQATLWASGSFRINHINVLFYLQSALDESEKRSMEYEFHSASYHIIMEIVTGLRTIIGHLQHEVSAQLSDSVHTSCSVYGE